MAAQESTLEREIRHLRQAAVYRVCAGPGRNWHVYDNSSGEPIASFAEKTAALSYAMNLAKGRTSLLPLLGNRGETADTGATPPRRPFDA